LLLALALLSCSRSPSPSRPAISERATATKAAEAAPSKSAAETDEDLKLDTIRLPKGFRIAAYATHVSGARSLALSSQGTLFVGSRDAGKVYAITNGGGHQGQALLVVAEGLDTPNGVALHHGALYVAEKKRILRFDAIEQHLQRPPAPVVVTDELPEQSEHEWKFIGIGPDEKLYVPIGAPCNICAEKDERFATIARMSLDGSGFELVARGVRNSVGFDWHPKTHALWFTENGRDRLGDDTPPDELNRVSKPGQHFGFPYCHGQGIVDPDYGKERGCGGTLALGRQSRCDLPHQLRALMPSAGRRSTEWIGARHRRELDRVTGVGRLVQRFDDAHVLQPLFAGCVWCGA
jgi:glucose/arabinose dehydrogenase